MTAVTLSAQSSLRIPMQQNESAVSARGYLDLPDQVMLAGKMSWIPKPERDEAALLQESLIAALSHRDGRWTATCLRLASTRLTTQEQPAAAWIPFVAGIALLERSGQPLHNIAVALEVLRGLIRETLSYASPDESTIWILPASGSVIDRTAAYVFSGCLQVRGGCDARPWLWAERPSSGICVVCGYAPRAHKELPTISVLPIPGVYNICEIANSSTLN